VTINSASTNGTYVGAEYSTGDAVAALNLTPSGTQRTLTITFVDPLVMEPGSYSDSVTTGICTDSTCTQFKSGTTVMVPVTYTVTVPATVNLSADPTTSGAGTSTTLTWSSTRAESCTASGDWSGTFPDSGSQVVTLGSVGDHVYTLSCSNPGTEAEASVTVTATPPIVRFSAYPANIVLGKTTTLRWSSQYANACVASGAWSGSLAAAGSRTLSPSTQGTKNYHLECSNSIASGSSDTTVTVAPVPAASPATAYRMSETHDGVLITSNGISHPGTSSPTWTVNLAAPVSYPLIANGRVFVTTANPNGSYGNRLYALNQQTGAIIWGPIAISGTYFGSGLTYDNGRIFVLMFDGIVRGFDASNGAPLWSAQLPGYWYEASPNAYGGIVFATGNAGLSALDEATGTILWTANSGGTTDWASPAVSSEGVYLQTGDCVASNHDPVVGTELWRSQSPCHTPWGYASILKNGTFFGRTTGSLNLFNAATGQFRVELGSERAPSITDNAVIALNAGTLSSTRLSDLAQTWTFTGDGHLVTAPVVVNDTVFVGSSSGKVYGLNASTGTQIWLGTSPVPITADSENGGPQPPSGPAAGENMLIFTAGNSLVAWQMQ
jgi:outer membrane protein assembly factor BamB